MTDIAPLILNSQADRRLKKGHLWIYSNEVNTSKTPLKAFEVGQLVQVQSASGQEMGTAFINPNALLCGRIVSRNSKAKINKAFLLKRLQGALALREMCFDGPYYRLVYGDSDFLPGVVIDRYGDYLVLQIAVAGFDRILDDLVAALQDLLSPVGIVVRNNHTARELEGLEDEVRVIGEVPEVITVEENGAVFEISPAGGQKTGWFYDHRENRAYMQLFAQDKTVLDVFSYVGGWGIEAGVAGASHITCIDSSEAAINGVLRNAELNEVSDKVEAIRGKAMDVLKAMVAEKRQFDIVILDPPAFIKKRKDQRAGEAAYRHLNELAIRLLGREGLLVSASCSMPLGKDTLLDIVRGAARHVDRNAQLIYSGGQGPDHPVHPAIPETDYLKAQFYRISSEL